MITMQYEFILPADYDMPIVYRRIREKGHFLDTHRPLLFKAYLTAQRDDPVTRSQENRYAPFYLWRDLAGLSAFLLSPGFQGIVDSFGRPTVRTWPVLLAGVQDLLASAAYAVRETHSVPAAATLSQLQKKEFAWADNRVHEQGDLLALSALEPAGWGLVRFRLLAKPPEAEIWEQAWATEIQAYNLRHLSNPGEAAIQFPEQVGAK